MTAITLFGFLVIVGIAMWMTVIAIGTAIVEKGLTNSVAFGWVFLAVAVALWCLVFWISPRYVSIGMQ